MDEAHKEKLRVARAAAREARKNAVDAQVEEGVPSQAYYGEPHPTDPNIYEVEVGALREELAALKDKHREKASHEYDTLSGREKVTPPESVGGAQEDVAESLRRLLREELAHVLPEREMRTTARDSVRPGAVIAYDRDGQPVYRKRDLTSDPFAIPEDLKEPGYEFQWVRVSVHGQEDISNQVNMQEQGWRFVQADRKEWDGRMMPRGYRGHIFKDGLALMERPKVLCDEARRESMQKVKEQSRAQREQFGLALPPGFTGQSDAARQYTFARQGRAEPTPASLKPGHHVDPTGGMDIDSH